MDKHRATILALALTKASRRVDVSVSVSRGQILICDLSQEAQHSLDLSVSDEERVLAHWQGFIENRRSEAAGRRAAARFWLARARSARSASARVRVKEALAACCINGSDPEALAKMEPGDYVRFGDSLPIIIDNMTLRTVYVRSTYWSRAPGARRSHPQLHDMYVDARRACVEA